MANGYGAYLIDVLFGISENFPIPMNNDGNDSNQLRDLAGDFCGWLKK
jgi:hypothetical protein